MCIYLKDFIVYYVICLLSLLGTHTFLKNQTMLVKQYLTCIQRYEPTACSLQPSSLILQHIGRICERGLVSSVADCKKCDNQYDKYGSQEFHVSW